ncbi:hypothetical protein OMD42_13470 [Aeromonas hydrophila]|uniref:hypothetical protein n=1 Tax=Aeromonas hydrophila TaxID=644 RepID=UPI00214E949F|nr:hypothetical protein [Aeromonas hydrophila]MCR3953541.1 hypothetical protein [Aeromonas hydrophila]MCW4616360.1 hypothetical protein [Aeromonas hydrophila]
MVKLLFSLLIGVALSGCSDQKTVTDPKLLVPVMLEAHKCCLTGACIGTASGTPENAACDDVIQISECLKGEEQSCPIKGYGAF